MPSLKIHALAIDSHDRLYAAVLPDAKIYRIEKGKPELFFDAKCKYIWAMTFEQKRQPVHCHSFLIPASSTKFLPKAKAKSFLIQKSPTMYTVIKSLSRCSHVIVGTEPSGLISYSSFPTAKATCCIKPTNAKSLPSPNTKASFTPPLSATNLQVVSSQLPSLPPSHLHKQPLPPPTPPRQHHRRACHFAPAR